MRELNCEFKRKGSWVLREDDELGLKNHLEVRSPRDRSEVA